MDKTEWQKKEQKELAERFDWLRNSGVCSPTTRSLLDDAQCLIAELMDAVLYPEEDFAAWADKSKAVTWTGKLGLKERWENRDNPEYQDMLKKVYGE